MTIPKLTPDQQARHDEVMRLVYDCQDRNPGCLARMSATIAQLCAQIDTAETFVHAQKLDIDLLQSERDQLKAENERLKSDSYLLSWLILNKHLDQFWCVEGSEDKQENIREDISRAISEG